MGEARLDSVPLSLPARVALATGGAIALAGCLLTSDFDGIVGSAPDGSAEEGGASSGTTPTPPGETGDGAPGIPDGSSPGNMCDAPHLLCTTFDTSATFPVPWGRAESSGGTLAIEPVGRSAPNALVGRLPDGADADPEAVLLRDVALGTFSKLTISFDFRQSDCPAQVANSLTLLFMRLGADYGVGFVLLSSGTLAVGTHGTNGDVFYPLEQTVQPDTWTKITIEVTPGTSELAIRALVDGQVAVNRSDAQLQTFNSTMSVGVGPTGVASPQGCTVAYDNIVADKE